MNRNDCKNIKENELELLKTGFVHVSTYTQTVDSRDIASTTTWVWCFWSFMGVELHFFIS